MPKECNISIDVATDYVDDQSDPDIDRYVFAYTITIANRGNVAAKLMSRHWVITDANNKVQEVRGDGVIGEQPYLKPGQSFRYTSGAMLETPVGCMEGSYSMISDDELEFDAPVPLFSLSTPHTLH